MAWYNVGQEENFTKMNKGLCLSLVVIFASIFSGCRHDFTIRLISDQSCVLKSISNTNEFRESILQYDDDTKSLYSSQMCYADDCYTTIVRKYFIPNGLQNEWVIKSYISESVPAVIVGNELYQADCRKWDGYFVDNLSVIDLAADNDISTVHYLKGTMPNSVSCQGLLRLGENCLLLKLLDTNTLMSSMALFDCSMKKIVNEIQLGISSNKDSVWYWKDYYVSFALAVSPDRKWLILRDENGILSLYDSSLRQYFAVSLKDVIGDDKSETNLDVLVSNIQGVKIDWVDNSSIMLWTKSGGGWCLYDVAKRDVVNKGCVYLQRKDANFDDNNDTSLKSEYISCVLGRNKFLVRGVGEGLFRWELYIVTVDEDGSNIRQKVDCGVLPRRMLTRDYFYADEF